MNPVVRFIDSLAKMGLWMRGDPPRSIDLTGRVWGEPAAGFVLSIREIQREERDQPLVLSTVMRNQGQDRKQLSVPGWLFFYQVQVDAAMTPYGAALLKPERMTERLEISLGPGDATETEVPVGLVYGLREEAEHTISVSCTLPDGSVLRSNELLIRA